MNKEQFIEQLQQLKDHLPQGELDKSRVLIDQEVENLTKKLANDDNYKVEGADVINANRIAQFSNKINEAASKLTVAKNNVTVLQRNITNAQTSIDVNQKVVDALNEELDKIGVEYRKNTNPTEDEDKEYKTRLEGKRATLDVHTEAISNLTNELSDFNAQLEIEKSNITKYQNDEDRYQNGLDQFNAKIKDSGNDIDVSSKIHDEAELAKMTRTQELLSNTFDYSSIDLDPELDRLIAGVKDDSITVEEAQDTLRSYRNNTSADSFNLLTDKLETEKQNTNELLNSVDSEISSLETKLGDEKNYLVSTFATEVINDQIDTLQINYEKALNDAVIADNEISSLTADLANNENEARQMTTVWPSYVREQINNAAIELASLDYNKDQERIAQLEKDIAEGTEELTTDYASRLASEHKAIEEQLHAAEARKAVATEKASRYDNIINAKKSRVNEVVNTSAKYKDQNRLATLKDTKAALQSRKDFLDFNFVWFLDDTISSNLVDSNSGKENDQVLPLKDSNDVLPSTEPNPKEEEDVIIPINENGGELPIDDDKKQKENNNITPGAGEVNPYADPNKEQTQNQFEVDDFDDPTDELKESAEKEDPLNKLQTALNEMNKSSDGFFKSWIKAHPTLVKVVSGVLIAGAVLFGIATGLSSCKSKNVADSAPSVSITQEDTTAAVSDNNPSVSDNNLGVSENNPTVAVTESDRDNKDVHKAKTEDSNKKDLKKIKSNKTKIKLNKKITLKKGEQFLKAGSIYSSNITPTGKENPKVLSESETVVAVKEQPKVEENITKHDVKPNTSIPGTVGQTYTTTTGGGVISQSSTVVDENVVNPDTNTATNSNTSSTTTGTSGSSASSSTEVVSGTDDTTVLPNLDGGVIINPGETYESNGSVQSNTGETSENVQVYVTPSETATPAASDTQTTTNQSTLSSTSVEDLQALLEQFNSENTNVEETTQSMTK